MSMTVDFHSHILPGIDDGSQNVEESVAMLRQEQAQGIDHIVATPHFYPQHDQLKHFLDRRGQAEEVLREKTVAEPNLPQLHIGAEVHFFSGIGDCDELSLLTIDGGRHIMIEMPHILWTDEMYRQLERIYTKRNLYPILAHIDRYLQGNRSAAKILERLADMPVMIQANAEFFLKRRTAKKAARMLQNRQIHLLGSDCHNLTDRSPNLADALKTIEKRAGAEGLDWIDRCAQAVLCD